MADTIPHIINIAMPEKSFIEVWTPLIGLLLTIITIIAGSIWNTKQIKNSHILLEKTIDAQWKNNLRETKLNFSINDLNLLERSRKDVVEELHIIEHIFKTPKLDKEKLKAIVHKFESSYAEFINLIILFDKHKNSMFSDLGISITNIIGIRFILQIYVEEKKEDKEDLDVLKRQESMKDLYKLIREFNEVSLRVINKLRDEILT